MLNSSWAGGEGGTERGRARVGPRGGGDGLAACRSGWLAAISLGALIRDTVVASDSALIRDVVAAW